MFLLTNVVNKLVYFFREGGGGCRPTRSSLFIMSFYDFRVESFFNIQNYIFTCTLHMICLIHRPIYFYTFCWYHCYPCFGTSWFSLSVASSFSGIPWTTKDNYVRKYWILEPLAKLLICPFLLPITSLLTNHVCIIPTLPFLREVSIIWKSALAVVFAQGFGRGWNDVVMLKVNRRTQKRENNGMKVKGKKCYKQTKKAKIDVHMRLQNASSAICHVRRRKNAFWKIIKEA